MEPKDLPGMPEVTPAMYGVFAYVVMAFLHWASGKGLPLLQQLGTWLSNWWTGNKKEIRDDAKDGPEREVKLLRESLEETKLTLKGVIAELIEQREKRHNCEVEVAEFRAELKHERAEKEELKQEVADQKKEIEELREQIRANVGDWKLLKKDVQKVQNHQDHQDQQNKTT